MPKFEFCTEFEHEYPPEMCEDIGKPKGDGNVSIPEVNETVCCEAMTAECEACKRGMPKFEFCAEFGHEYPPEMCEDIGIPGGDGNIGIPRGDGNVGIPGVDG